MAWGFIFEGRVGALGVVVVDESGDRRACGVEVVKAVQPDAFLFEGADEALAQPVLLGGVGVMYCLASLALRAAFGWLSPPRSGSCVRP